MSKPETFTWQKPEWGFEARLDVHGRLGSTEPATVADVVAALSAEPQLRAAVLEGLGLRADLATALKLQQDLSFERLDYGQRNERRAEAAEERLRAAESALSAAHLENANLNQALGKAQGEAEGHALVRRGVEAELATERARVVAAEAMVEDSKLLAKMVIDNGYERELLRTAQRILASRPAEQAKDPTAGGGDSPAEPKERVTHDFARRSLGHLPDCGARLVVERYIDQCERYEQESIKLDTALEQGEEWAAKVLAVEAERDDLKRRLERTSLDFANACDKGRRLEAQLEAAQASAVDLGELEHLREAAELLRSYFHDEASGMSFDMARDWYERDQKRAAPVAEEPGGFGCNPEDSAELLKLRQAIDKWLPFATDGARELGDYVGAVTHVGVTLGEHPEWREAFPRDTGWEALEPLSTTSEPAAEPPQRAEVPVNSLTGWRKNPTLLPETAECRHRWVAHDGSCVDCEAPGLLPSLEPPQRAEVAGGDNFQERLLANGSEMLAVTREALKLYERIAGALDRLAPELERKL